MPVGKAQQSARRCCGCRLASSPTLFPQHHHHRHPAYIAQQQIPQHFDIIFIALVSSRRLGHLHTRLLSPQTSFVSLNSCATSVVHSPMSQHSLIDMSPHTPPFLPPCETQLTETTDLERELWLRECDRSAQVILGELEAPRYVRGDGQNPPIQRRRFSYDDWMPVVWIPEQYADAMMPPSTQANLDDAAPLSPARHAPSNNSQPALHPDTTVVVAQTSPSQGLPPSVPPNGTPASVSLQIPVLQPDGPSADDDHQPSFDQPDDLHPGAGVGPDLNNTSRSGARIPAAIPNPPVQGPEEEESPEKAYQPGDEVYDADHESLSTARRVSTSSLRRPPTRTQQNGNAYQERHPSRNRYLSGATLVPERRPRALPEQYFERLTLDQSEINSSVEPDNPHTLLERARALACLNGGDPMMVLPTDFGLPSCYDEVKSAVSPSMQPNASASEPHMSTPIPSSFSPIQSRLPPVDVRQVVGTPPTRADRDCLSGQLQQPESQQSQPVDDAGCSDSSRGAASSSVTLRNAKRMPKCCCNVQ